MHLLPAAVQLAENAAGANREIETPAVALEITALPAHGVKESLGFVQRVIMEFDVDLCRPVEYPLIDSADFFPTATQTAKGIGHGDLLRPRPVTAHGAEVAGVEGAVKAYECIQRGMTAY